MTPCQKISQEWETMEPFTLTIKQWSAKTLWIMESALMEKAVHLLMEKRSWELYLTLFLTMPASLATLEYNLIVNIILARSFLGIKLNSKALLSSNNHKGRKNRQPRTKSQFKSWINSLKILMTSKRAHFVKRMISVMTSNLRPSVINDSPFVRKLWAISDHKRSSLY
jgi:hypothetical protein